MNETNVCVGGRSEHVEKYKIETTHFPGPRAAVYAVCVSLN